MGLLKPAVNEQAYLKAGTFGGAGSGKTTTASHIALAISNRLGNKQPVAFFETEAGSDFLVDRFKEEGVPLLRVKSHSLADLQSVVKEAEKECSCLIVDSITHVWQEVCEAKLRAVNAARKKKGNYLIDKLEFQHWGDVKREWAKWTSLFLNASLHIIVCGRAGNVWDVEVNEESGKKEIIKGQSKMKAEGEFGYEPSLLIEMERVPKGNAAGAGWIHRAHILKDRTDTINGMAFDFERPKKGYKKGDWAKTFKPFQPVIDHLNIGGQHITYDTTRTSETLFPGADGESRSENRGKRVTIALEEIQGALVALWPGMDAGSKAAKAVAIEALFGTRSWTAVESKSLEDLEFSLKGLRIFEANYKDNLSFESADALRSAIGSCKSDAIDEPIEKDDLPDGFNPPGTPQIPENSVQE
jgi:hypothetical protein